MGLEGVLEFEFGFEGERKAGKAELDLEVDALAEILG